MENISKAKLLDLAKQAVVDRGLNYGKPEDNFRRIARRWQVHFLNRYGIFIQFDSTDVAIMCVDLKLARLDNNADHLDSWIDVAGYAACGANINCAPRITEDDLKIRVGNKDDEVDQNGQWVGRAPPSDSGRAWLKEDGTYKPEDLDEPGD